MLSGITFQSSRNSFLKVHLQHTLKALDDFYGVRRSYDTVLTKSLVRWVVIKHQSVTLTYFTEMRSESGNCMIPLYAQTGLQSGNISKLEGFTHFTIQCERKFSHQVSDRVQHSRVILAQFIHLKAVLFHHLFIHIHIHNYIHLFGYLAWP